MNGEPSESPLPFHSVWVNADLFQRFIIAAVVASVIPGSLLVFGGTFLIAHANGGGGAVATAIIGFMFLFVALALPLVDTDTHLDNWLIPMLFCYSSFVLLLNSIGFYSNVLLGALVGTIVMALYQILVAFR